MNINERKWSVYKHTSPSGKVYIGITSREPSVRWGKNGIHYKGQPFYNAIEKYGWENISHEILFDNLTEEDAKKTEIEQIAKYRSKEWEYGYNCTLGGDGALGYVRSQEAIQGTIDGNSKTIYQYSIDGEFIQGWKSAITIERELRYSATCIGSCCLGRRKQAYGYIWKHNYVEKVEAITIGLESNPIYQYSLDGKYIKSWESGKQVERELGFYATNIYLCCNGGQISAYGYLWSYDKKENIEGLDHLEFSQYDLDGNYIKTFNNVQKASEELGYKNLAIHEVCRGERRQAGGFLWSYERKNKIEPVKEKHMKNNANSKKVYQYTLQGNFIQEWISVSEVERELGYSRSMIVDCCNGKRNLACGYLWSYIKVDKMKKVIPKIRKIKQYTLDKKLIKIWNSATEIKNILGCDNGEIARCCKREISTYKNFIWIYEDENINDIELFEKKDKKCREVIQLTEDNEYITTFSSITKAAQATGIERRKIGECCSGKCETVGGFIWKYA